VGTRPLVLQPLGGSSRDFQCRIFGACQSHPQRRARTHRLRETCQTQLARRLPRPLLQGRDVAVSARISTARMFINSQIEGKITSPHHPPLLVHLRAPATNSHRHRSQERRQGTRQRIHTKQLRADTVEQRPTRKSQMSARRLFRERGLHGLALAAHPIPQSHRVLTLWRAYGALCLLPT